MERVVIVLDWLGWQSRDLGSNPGCARPVFHASLLPVYLTYYILCEYFLINSLESLVSAQSRQYYGYIYVY